MRNLLGETIADSTLVADVHNELITKGAQNQEEPSA